MRAAKCVNQIMLGLIVNVSILMGKFACKSNQLR